MGTKEKPTLQGLVSFGRRLIETRDLDPIYVMLYNSGLRISEIGLLHRWLLAYWCYYHAGVASWAADAWCSKVFWERMKEAFNKKYPRGFERRHFRGDKAIKAIEVLSQTPPEVLVMGVLEPVDFSAVSARIQQWPQFGPWIAWKAADMGERVLSYPIRFDNASINMFEDPRKGAAMVLEGDENATITDVRLSGFVEYLINKPFADLLAPPRFDRPVNVQEIETILCKYKSHCHGRYPLGEDSRAIKKALGGNWGELARHLSNFVPEVKEE